MFRSVRSAHVGILGDLRNPVYKNSRNSRSFLFSELFSYHSSPNTYHTHTTDPQLPLISHLSFLYEHNQTVRIYTSPSCGGHFSSSSPVAQRSTPSRFQLPRRR